MVEKVTGSIFTQFATKKEEPVQAPQMYIISKSCSYVPVRADYSQVLPGALPSVQPD